MRGITLLLMSLVPVHMTAAQLLIGTFTDTGASHGIYSVQLDEKTGALGAPTLAAEAQNPSFLVRAPGTPWIYATGETTGENGARTGAVCLYAQEPATGALRRLSSQPVPGESPCHLATTRDGRLALSSIYREGLVCAFPVSAEGQLAPQSAAVATAGPVGPRADRQDHPHAHSTTLSPDERHAYVCDLGLDRLFIYRIDAAKNALVPAEPAFAQAPAGAGPRHATFSADGRFLHVLNELASSVSVYACDPATGALELRSTHSTLPAGATGQNISAEVRLHPSGRFLYASNRGHDSLAVFQRGPATGALTLLETVPCGGRHPRHFALSPDGRWLICANRDTDNLTVFAIDPATGRLAATPHTATVPQPTCVIFPDSP